MNIKEHIEAERHFFGGLRDFNKSTYRPPRPSLVIVSEFALGTKSRLNIPNPGCTLPADNWYGRKLTALPLTLSRYRVMLACGTLTPCFDLEEVERDGARGSWARVLVSAAMAGGLLFIIVMVLR